MAVKRPSDERRVTSIAKGLAEMIAALSDEPCPKCGTKSLTFEGGHTLQILCENASDKACGFMRFFSYADNRKERATVVSITSRPKIGVLLEPE